MVHTIVVSSLEAFVAAQLQQMCDATLFRYADYAAKLPENHISESIKMDYSCPAASP
jgi:hypothetical protein